ncbi:MAG: TetR/AcrR family transcriptional regulator [Solirubrobacteraceae bacterium]
MTTRPTQQQRRERTRRALIEAAAEVFAREGFAAARVEEIAERAHLTTGALYAHFQSKQGLFLAVFDEFAAMRVQEVKHSSTDGETGTLTPAAGADQWMGRLDEAPWRFWLHLEFAHYASRDPELRERFALSTSAVRLAIQQVIEAHAARNDLEIPISAQWLATVIRALGMGLSLERLTDPEAVPAEMFGQAVELLVSLLESSHQGALGDQPASDAQEPGRSSHLAESL